MTASDRMSVSDVTQPVNPSSGNWLRELTLVALNADRPGTLTDVAGVIGAATDSSGTILWESPDARAPSPQTEPSVLSVWLARGGPGQQSGHVIADELTRQAYRERTLILARPEFGERVTLFGLNVAAALPVDYADGSRGVLTLLGSGGLTNQAFDATADLLSILPEVLTVLRERCTLALVNSCNRVLHQADVESPSEPLSQERLKQYFADVCQEVARAVSCTEASIFLRTPSGSPDEYQFFASSSGNPMPSEEPAPLRCEDPPRARVSSGAMPMMEVPLTSGDYVWGVLRCQGAFGPPFHFTQSELSLLYPVAAQVAAYWATWIHRQTISLENASWRRLAAGITNFNNILAEELRGNGGQRSRRHELVGSAALRLVRDVVPDATGGAVRLLLEDGTGEVEHTEIVAPQTEPVPVTDGGLSTRQPIGSAGRWTLTTPIKVGNREYGVLTAMGVGLSAPANSVQVCEIMSDQLGLYRQLEHTMSRLHEARHSLKASLRGQAEAMEDLKHQLVSPLRTATDRTDLVLRLGRLDTRAQAQLRAVRGLCRKASRVAMSAGVFAALSKDQLPRPRNEVLGMDDLLRMMIAAADDAQLLSNPSQKITFDVDRDAMLDFRRQLVHADMSFLQQCLGNLLDNATKYSYPGNQVRISGAVADRELALAVTSTGMPIRPAEAIRCLERNWRGAEARNWTGEGSGIGLWIVDNLMRSMAGRVEIKPAAEITTVRLFLPIA